MSTLLTPTHPSDLEQMSPSLPSPSHRTTVTEHPVLFPDTHQVRPTLLCFSSYKVISGHCTYSLFILHGTDICFPKPCNKPLINKFILIDSTSADKVKGSSYPRDLTGKNPPSSRSDYEPHPESNSRPTLAQSDKYWIPSY